MTFLALMWLIPLLPLAGFVINGLVGRRLPRQVAGGIACAAVLAAFVLCAGAAWELSALGHSGGAMPASHADTAGQTATTAPHGLHLDPSVPRVSQTLWTWIQVGELQVNWGYAIDPLSVVMLLIVTGVGFLIHIYSLGYMAHDEGLARFFAYLNLFMAMMLVLVLADSFLVMFVGWEGVGLCSYLLIGFNYGEMFDEGRGMSCADAGRKAFLVNRIGDYGFMLGMLLILVTFGSLSFDVVFAAVRGAGGDPALAGLFTAMALLLFVGAAGKSAQIPLYVWLPDAMAGPTPVSALIHAATMVTAGVYMVCRCAALFVASPAAMATVAVVGAATAVLAALIGCTQFDIKKVLAYSTVSQLGYMFLAAGVGAFSFAIFHVMTHAFFKALLFLGAGSVIHAMSGEQDIRKMGALRRALPWTFWTFALAALAIAGLPPGAGFFSKDAILAAVFFKQPWLWGVGAFTAGITAFYMWRLVFLTFLSTDRVEADARAQLHESPWSMVAPLAVLALLSGTGGFLGVPQFLAGLSPVSADILPHFLAPVFTSAGAGDGMGALSHTSGAPIAVATEWALTAASVALALLGMGVAWLFYAKGGDLPARTASALGGAYRLAKDRFRIDELYDATVLRAFRILCQASDAFDRFVVDLAVNLVGILAEISGHILKLLQTGAVRAYALAIFIGAVAVLYLLVLA